ncbi:MAG: Polymyxin resistance protein PmrI [Candidatus Accumulibacter adjunctus]|uniref:Polymyxin resistance protein PmrI n=1 Tax=Candidatus Accumulibacter adjunctus TaxID=1454001 RepID=A0A011PTA6_9PROT|nr:MAG: Polymyxin resistance protein PmrI [Candidatus Accumulibacter adjunctus]
MLRILLFGDAAGVSQLLRHLPVGHVVGIVGAAVRPQYHDDLLELAARMTVPFLVQPRWGSPEYAHFVGAIEALGADLIWVNSYSMIIRADVLSLSRLGGINIHHALLPRNRGCNPIQWAIINRDTETGVTLHELTSGIDEGPIIAQRRVALLFEDTWQTLRDRLARATDELIAANLPQILSGSWTAHDQDERAANYCCRRTPDDGLFRWSQPVVAIYNHIRALLPPLPPAFYVDGEGRRVGMDRYFTPCEVTALKYGPLGGCVLEADSVRLRPLWRTDAPLVEEWSSHDEARILNAASRHCAEQDHLATVEATIAERTDRLLFVIEERASSKAIGTCRLQNIGWRHRNAELRVRISDGSSAHEAYAAEAIRLLCRFAFVDLSLHRICLHPAETELSIIRACEKAGFVREGSLTEAVLVDGRWLDLAVMGLIERDE